MTEFPFSEAIEAERLRQLRALIEETLREFDVCAAFTLAGRGGRAETCLHLGASWSCASVEGQGIRFRSRAADYAGDKERQQREQEWTLGALSNLGGAAGMAALVLIQATDVIAQATGAEQTPMRRDDPRDKGKP